MTIREYLDDMIREVDRVLDAHEVDKDRQICNSDLGLIFAACSSISAKVGRIPNTPKDIKGGLAPNE